MRIRPIRPVWLFDKYVLGELIGPFLGGAVFFLFVFLMFQLLRWAEFFIVHGVPASVLARMAALLSLSFLPVVLPITFLMAVLIAFGRLSSDHEIVAIKASGVSLARLTVPVSVFAVIVAGLSLALNMEWVPWGEFAFKKMLVKVGNTKVVSSIKEGRFTSGFFDLLVFADRVETKTNQMSRVFIYDEREPKNPLTVVARSGEVIPLKTPSQLGSAIVLRLNNGSIHRSDIKEGTYQKMDFGEYRLYLKMEEAAGAESPKPQMMPYHELSKKIASTSTATREGRELRGEYWRRYAVALTPLIFVFMGVGYGTFRTRAVRTGAGLIALVTVLLYWIIQTGAVIAVQNGVLPPFLAMQLPNVVVFAAAVYGYRKAMW